MEPAPKAAKLTHTKANFLEAEANFKNARQDLLKAYTADIEQELQETKNKLQLANDKITSLSTANIHLERKFAGLDILLSDTEDEMLELQAKFDVVKNGQRKRQS